MTEWLGFFADLVESCHRGKPALPEPIDEASQRIEGFLTHRDKFDVYLLGLAAATKGKSFSEEEDMPLSEYEMQAVMDGRWKDVDEAALAVLLTRPKAMYQLSFLIVEVSTPYWCAVYERMDRWEEEFGNDPELEEGHARATHKLCDALQVRAAAIENKEEAKRFYRIAEKLRLNHFT